MGIIVMNTPDANATTTAELAIAHLMSLSRHLPKADRSVRAGKWERSKLMGSEVAHKTLAILGFGTHWAYCLTARFRLENAGHRL